MAARVIHCDGEDAGGAHALSRTMAGGEGRSSRRGVRLGVWPLAKQAAFEGLEIRPCKLRIVPAIKTALVNEIGIGQRIFGIHIFSVKWLALHVASDHWPNLDAGACERHCVFLEKLLATADERHGEWRYGLYVRMVESDEIGMMGDDIVDLGIVPAPRTDVVVQKRKLV